MKDTTHIKSRKRKYLVIPGPKLQKVQGSDPIECKSLTRALSVQAHYLRQGYTTTIPLR